VNVIQALCCGKSTRQRSWSGDRLVDFPHAHAGHDVRVFSGPLRLGEGRFISEVFWIVPQIPFGRGAKTSKLCIVLGKKSEIGCWFGGLLIVSTRPRQTTGLVARH
jgi:hypothetical protein